MNGTFAQAMQRFLNARSGGTEDELANARQAMFHAARVMTPAERFEAATEIWEQHTDVPPYDVVHQALNAAANNG